MAEARVKAESVVKISAMQPVLSFGQLLLMMMNRLSHSRRQPLLATKASSDPRRKSLERTFLTMSKEERPQGRPSFVSQSYSVGPRSSSTATPPLNALLTSPMHQRY